MSNKAPPSVSVDAGSLRFRKLNVDTWEWRDTYHWILSLSWPRFAALVLSVYLAVNLTFAALYALGRDCIAELPSGSFPQAFFFSVETLATVGYGHMYPATVYGHILTTLEIIVGMFWTAVITGLIFVRFSRPAARVVFSDSVVVAPFDGVPTLMLRVANLRHHTMVEAHFRLMLLRDELTLEGDTMRRFRPLKLMFDYAVLFPAALTLRHVIDEQSPLYGAVTPEHLQKGDVRLMASIVCIDAVTQSPVHMQRDYIWQQIRLGEQFVEIYTEEGSGRMAVDYGRLHETERVGTGRAPLV